MPKLESRVLFPLDFVHDSPCPAELLEKLNPKVDVIRKKSMDTDRKKSLDSESLFVKSHSSKPSMEKPVPVEVEIQRSPEVNDMITKMFGDQPASNPSITQPILPTSESDHEINLVDEHKDVVATGSRFSKIAVGTSFVARKVQKSLVSAKESFTSVPPAAPAPLRTTTSASLMSMDDGSSQKLKKLNEGIGQYLADYSKQHQQLKSDLEEQQIVQPTAPLVPVASVSQVEQASEHVEPPPLPHREEKSLLD